jgi:hypothetical protein
MSTWPLQSNNRGQENQGTGVPRNDFAVNYIRKRHSSEETADHMVLYIEGLKSQSSYSSVLVLAILLFGGCRAQTDLCAPEEIANNSIAECFAGLARTNNCI